MARKETQILKEIRDVHCQLSPENLACDGEATRTFVRQKQRVLLAALRRLESEFGRKPTEKELWNPGCNSVPIPAKPAVTTGVYLELFHGRTDPKEQMDDWGELGPVFGPFKFVHTTYGVDLKMAFLNDDNHVNLAIQDGLILYDGIYFGDWSVFDTKVFRESHELKARYQDFDQAKADHA